MKIKKVEFDTKNINTEIDIENLYEIAESTKNVKNIQTNASMFKVNIKSLLTVDEYMSFISNVVECCFDDDGEYIAHAKSLAIGVELIDKYTDLWISDKDLTLEDKSLIIYNTDIIELIKDSVNKFQYTELMSSVNSQIEYRIKTSISANENKLNAIINEFENIFNQTKSVIDGMSTDDISTLFENLKTIENMTEDDVVNSFIKIHEGNKDNTDKTELLPKSTENTTE